MTEHTFDAAAYAAAFHRIAIERAAAGDNAGAIRAQEIAAGWAARSRRERGLAE